MKVDTKLDNYNDLRNNHKAGIYKITNLINGKLYIGQSIDIYK